VAQLGGRAVLVFFGFLFLASATAFFAVAKVISSPASAFSTATCRASSGTEGAASR
jgi:hypothetical protein